MNLSPRLWNAVIATSLLGTSAVQAGSCSVPGGTSSSPTDFARYVSNEACSEFILQDGWYTFPNLNRSAITIRAEHAGKAQIKNGFSISAPGVTIEGISRDGERGPIAVRAPGTIIRECHFSNFGKTVYGRAVWIWNESLSADRVTVITNNTFCKSSGWAGIIWDKNSGGTFSGIVWQDNVFYATRGRAISWSGDYDRSIWDESDNVYWSSPRPTQPTTGSTGSSIEMDPKFAGIPDNFTITAPTLVGKGAKWPPCP